MLKIENLHAEIDGKPILKGLSLTVNAGEIHAIMGPNGAGKSTLGYVLGGRPGYEVTEGSILFRPTAVTPALSQGPASADGGEDSGTPDQVRGDDEWIDLLELEPNERAAAGVFLGFQYPVEIPGVSNVQFLREALNAQRATRDEKPLSGAEFLKLARAQAASLEMDAEMLKRPVNVGFSGGEKKRNEILQMAMLEPRMCILDETDSGLDVDAMKLVADGVNALRAPDRAFLVITHYQRLLDYIVPDRVHVLMNGRIVKSGGPELAQELEAQGYGAVQAAA